MKPPCLPAWYSWTERTTAVSSYLVNALLILLIVFRTPRNLRVYRRMLICNSLVDLFFTTTSLLIELVGHFTEKKEFPKRFWTILLVPRE